VGDERDDALRRQGFERVYVELDWYDGPRAGVVDIDEQPHYFRATKCDDEYLVSPASQVALDWEREQ
jgi:hypothetical protein